jgi:hypothetical protein
VIFTSECRALGEGAITTYFKRLRFDAADSIGARTRDLPDAKREHLVKWSLSINDNYRLFALKRRQNDKTTKGKVDKTINVVFSHRKDDKTKRQQNEKSTRRQNAKRKVDKYIIQPANLSSFRSAFCRLVVFSGRKDDNYRFVILCSVVFSRRQIRSLISGLCLSSFRLNFVVLSICRLFGAKRR